jgi:hypothetical protein
VLECEYSSSQEGVWKAGYRNSRFPQGQVPSMQCGSRRVCEPIPCTVLYSTISTAGATGE